MSQVVEHFDQIAKDYDFYKKKNWYYYANLKKLYQEIIPPKSKILDIGCGTGDILSVLNPRDGLGLDISPKMIERAKAKYIGQKNLRFLAGGMEEHLLALQRENWDFIIMVDVVEHLEEPDLYFKMMAEIARSNTKLIFSMANPLWEPVLLVLEKLKLKMPEGPHRRLSLASTRRLLDWAGFIIKEEGYRLILPKNIPFFSDFINNIFYRIPLIQRLGLTVFYVCQK